MSDPTGVWGRPQVANWWLFQIGLRKSGGKGAKVICVDLVISVTYSETIWYFLRLLHFCCWETTGKSSGHPVVDLSPLIIQMLLKTFFFMNRIVTDILNFIGNHSTVKRRYAAEYMSSNVEPVIYAMPEKEEIVEKASKLSNARVCLDLSLRKPRLLWCKSRKWYLNFFPQPYSQSLNYIIGKVGVHKKDARFFVCPLDELLYEICLSSKFGKEAGGATSKQVAHIQLQKDTRYIWMDGLKCEFHSALPEGRDVTNEQCARALSMTHAFRFLAVGCIAHQGKLCCTFNL